MTYLHVTQNGVRNNSGGNFTNILRAAFSNESFANSFFVNTLYLGHKNIGANAADKILLKLIPGGNPLNEI